MRKNIVAGNWKMNNTLQEGVNLAKEIAEKIGAKNDNGVKVILGTPFIHITEVNKIVDHKRISVASQNCATESKGAYTGETSVSMIKSTGTEYVIVGHSERRAYYGEDNAILLQKTKMTLSEDLIPIFCCGEILEERESGRYFDVVNKQLEETVFTLSAEDFSKVVIAYEPVWAIGTGKTASSEQAQEIHQFIRSLITKKYNAEIADNTTILYGGSCNAKNAKELFANPDVDGGLIGGASLKADDFIEIIYSF